jgi:hypothetical protein
VRKALHAIALLKAEKFAGREGWLAPASTQSESIQSCGRGASQPAIYSIMVDIDTLKGVQLELTQGVLGLKMMRDPLKQSSLIGRL